MYRVDGCQKLIKMVETDNSQMCLHVNQAPFKEKKIILAAIFRCKPQ